LRGVLEFLYTRTNVNSSVADPDPNPDLHVLGLPDPDPLVRAMDPDPSILCKNSKKNLDSYYFVTLFDILSLKNDVNVPSKRNKQKKLFTKFIFC
jgi:hypothetical protein